MPYKTAAILRAVVELADEIERQASGHVAFHFKGRSVIPELGAGGALMAGRLVLLS